MIIFLILFFLSLECFVFSSPGDYDPNYRICIRNCGSTCNEYHHKNVTINAMNNQLNYQIPLYELIPLDCFDICKYGCIELITTIRLKQFKEPMIKYYGHWPFIRYFGMEEPASSIFSLFNIIPHLQYIIRYIWCFKIHNDERNSYFMSNWILLYALASSIAFICSTLYHAKKTKFFTLLDLISALFFIITGLFIAIRRILLSPDTNQYLVKIIGLVLYSFFLYRAYYMILGNISFNNHMQISIILIVITTILWMLWIILINHNQQTESNKYNKIRYFCLICQIWLMLSSLLEIFDFPPLIMVFDAHSLWYELIHYIFCEEYSCNNLYFIPRAVYIYGFI